MGQRTRKTFLGKTLLVDRFTGADGQPIGGRAVIRRHHHLDSRARYRDTGESKGSRIKRVRLD